MIAGSLLLSTVQNCLEEIAGSVLSTVNNHLECDPEIAVSLYRVLCKNGLERDPEIVL